MRKVFVARNIGAQKSEGLSILFIPVRHEPQVEPEVLPARFHLIHLSQQRLGLCVLLLTEMEHTELEGNIRIGGTKPPGLLQRRLGFGQAIGGDKNQAEVVVGGDIVRVKAKGFLYFLEGLVISLIIVGKDGTIDEDFGFGWGLRPGIGDLATNPQAGQERKYRNLEKTFP